MAAILESVQFHINWLTSHCVNRCCVLSTGPQVRHRFVSVRLIAAERSLVGVRLWITTYHVDRWAFEIHAVWRLVHRCFQLASEYLRTTRITSLLSMLLRMALSTTYIRLLNLRRGSFVRRGITCHFQSILEDMDKFARDSVYMWGGFPLHRLGSTFVRRQLSLKPSARRMSTFSQERSARHFRTMSGRTHVPRSFGLWIVVVGTRKVAPFHINHVQVDVSCWMWRVGGGKTCARYHIFAKR